MNEKVKVSKEVAEAIEREKRKLNGYNDNQLFSTLFENKINRRVPELIGIGSIEFAKMLLNGYEVEQTPEEKILAEYNWRKPFNCGIEGRIYREGMKFVLNAYNIQIQGVNA